MCITNWQTIRMKCQDSFSMKNKRKNKIKVEVSSAAFGIGAIKGPIVNTCIARTCAYISQ